MYNLKSLSEVEQFVKVNKHLPEVPTTAEVQKDGIDIGTTQATLLKKIEELTLYMIEQNKKITAQEQVIQLLLNNQKTLQIQNKALQQKLEQKEQ